MKVKLPYLNLYRSGGKLYYYVRRKGLPNVRLDGAPGTAEFMASYQAALASTAPRREGRWGTGTFGKLVTDFYESVEFANLKPSSRSQYQRILDPAAVKHGHRPAATMPPEVAVKMIQEIGRDRPGLANLTRSVMRRLMKHGKIVPNPFDGIPAYKKIPHHTWTEAELAAFETRWPLGTRQRLAYALLLYTGQRGGDVAKMLREEISDGCIRVVQEKTGAELSIPIQPSLQAALKAGPVHIKYLVTDLQGHPLARGALTDMMKRAAKAAGLPPHCVPHGLRKALMRRLAESGSSAKEIAAVSGHKTLKEIERYTAAADQRLLSRAAMGKLSDEG
jgi:enterobacteria phage integrase